jgi:hypothetical protein
MSAFIELSSDMLYLIIVHSVGRYFFIGFTTLLERYFPSVISIEVPGTLGSMFTEDVWKYIDISIVLMMLCA